MDIPFSNQYLHDLKVLSREHAEQQITDEVFNQRLDKLREREAKSQKNLGQILLIQQFGEAEKHIATEVQKELLQRKQETQREEQAKNAEQIRKQQKQWREQQAEDQRLQQQMRKRENERDTYRNEIDTYINRLEENAQRWQHWYSWLQITLLLFSATTATLAGIDGIPRWIVAIIGLLATIVGSLLTTFKIQERIYASRKAIAEVRLECQKYDYHVEEYKNMDTEDAFLQFSRSVSLIQGQQMLQEVELWNPKKEEQKQERPLHIEGEKEPRDKPENISQEEAEEQHEETTSTNRSEEQ